MVNISVEGITKIEQDKKKRVDKLHHLISQDFNLQDAQHLAVIKKYNDNFELMQNQMYFFNGMSFGLWLWGGSFLLKFFLPIPDFSSLFLTLGLVGTACSNFRITDFLEQLNELKIIYNWCLKENQSGMAPLLYQYKDTIDNTDKLMHPEIQRMMMLLAPVCTIDYIRVWPQAPQKIESTGFLGIVGKAIQSGYKGFFPVAKSSSSSEQLMILKRQMEANNFSVNALDGFKKSVHYFATNTTFREILAAKCHYPISAFTSMKSAFGA